MVGARREGAPLSPPYGTYKYLRRAQVDLALGDVGELLVGRLLFLEVLIQQVGDVVAAEPLRPRDQRAVAGDLIMLDRLRGGDDRGVEHLVVGNLAGHVLGFLDDAVDRRTVDAFRVRAVQPEYLLE